MRNKKPPFEITNTMIHEVAEIAELVGKLIKCYKSGHWTYKPNYID